MNTNVNNLRNQEDRVINQIRKRTNETHPKELVFPLITKDDLVSLKKLDTTYFNHVVEAFFTEKHLALKQSFFNFIEKLSSDDKSVLKLEEMSKYLFDNFTNLKSRHPMLLGFIKEIEDKKNIIFFEIAKKYEEMENWPKVNQYMNKISNEPQYAKYKNNFRIPSTIV